jgi:hypothetical protein
MGIFSRFFGEIYQGPENPPAWLRDGQKVRVRKGHKLYVKSEGPDGNMRAGTRGVITKRGPRFLDRNRYYDFVVVFPKAIDGADGMIDAWTSIRKQSELNTLEPVR